MKMGRGRPPAANRTIHAHGAAGSGFKAQPHHSQMSSMHHSTTATMTSAFHHRAAPYGGHHMGVKGGFDGPMVAPWRKTVSIFKQPVTLVHTTARETRQATPNELQAAAKLGPGRHEKPKQVFWAKRLEGLRAMMPLSADELAYKDQETTAGGGERTDAPTETEPLALPSRILPAGPDVNEDVASASLSSALQAPPLSNQHQPPITGQTNLKKHLDSNPGVFTNPDQPLIHAVVISDQDIVAQERRVLDGRRRLEEAMKHFG